jgi:hypothetical protein
MEKIMANPLYSLKFITGNGVRTYVVGEIQGAVPGLNVSPGTYALSSDEKQSFVLINKDQLRVFTTRSSELK